MRSASRPSPTGTAAGCNLAQPASLDLNYSSGCRLAFDRNSRAPSSGGNAMSSTEMFSTDRTTEHHGGAQPGKRFRQLSRWQVITAGALAAAVVNLVIFFIGGAAGASFAFLDRGNLHEVGTWGVIIATVCPLAVGTGLATLLAHWWSWVTRWAQVIGGGFALLTMAGPLMTDADGATKVALALMHVMVAVAAVVTLEAIRRRTKTSRQA